MMDWACGRGLLDIGGCRGGFLVLASRIADWWPDFETTTPVNVRPSLASNRCVRNSWAMDLDGSAMFSRICSRVSFLPIAQFGPHAAAFVVDSVAGFTLHGAGGEEQGCRQRRRLQGQDSAGLTRRPMRPADFVG